MNAHRPHSLYSRHNAAAFTFLFLFIVVVVFGLTQSSATASGGSGQKPQLMSGEDLEKEFNDDDLKMKEQKPRGKWASGIESDMNQFNDVSLPVAVGAIQSLSGGGKYAGVVKIKRVEIKNRSSKTVSSVQLGWEITSLDNPIQVLSEGATPFLNTRVEANSSLIIEVPPLYPALMLRQLAKEGELNGRFLITIGVQEVRFADGSFWRRQESVTWLNPLYFDGFLTNRYPYLASILQGAPLPPASLVPAFSGKPVS